ncbi:MAG: hypothetical protein NC253_11035 [Ruminococcus sp.]|nr:hypothetical protein [Ruminococcus sp.]MCM1381226.1 hypothetical protein [Muribaculaceae bacterium]MCM1478808.1 hypothetical protein [Muribaculaceae bacterium]
MESKYIERPPKMSDEERRKKHIEANKKYNKENYKKIQANVKPEDYQIIDDYCKNNKISKAKFIVEACKFYIENKTK